MRDAVVNIKSQSGEGERPVLIIYTGGTMGMTYDISGSLSPFDFENIFHEMPVLESMGLAITVVSFSDPIDSSNVTVEHWNKLAAIIKKNYQDYYGFVVLHGTDTLAYSASVLSFMLEGLAKPVIFTGSQLPIGAVRTDATQNLIAALQIASSSGSSGPQVREVCIYFDYFLYRGNRCKKVESTHFDAFESENYPPLAELGITIDYNFSAFKKTVSNGLFTVHSLRSVQLAVLKLFPGLSQSYLDHVLQTPGLQGIIMETFGSGNAPTSTWFIEAITEAIANDIIIFNVSQCNGGRFIQGRYATSKQLQKAGVISGDDITTEAALAKMQFLFSNYPGNDQIEALLATPLRGEMSH